jgi:hypothetical protein
MKKIAGKILLLLKNIHLQKPVGEDARLSQFPMGRRARHQMSGISLNWWTTARSKKACQEIAVMIQAFPDFELCDFDTIEETVMDTLKHLTMDNRFFRDLLGSKENSLFDCLSTTDLEMVGSDIAREILQLLKERMVRWCVVFAAPKFKGPSFSIEEDRVQIIAKMEKKTWDDFWTGRYKATGWSPIDGKFVHRPEGSVFSGEAYDYLFTVEVEGTHRFGFELGQLRLMKFFAVLYAYLTSQRKENLFRVMAEPYTRGLQFPGIEASSDFGIHYVDFGSLVPRYADEVIIEPNDIEALQNWYRAQHLLEPTLIVRTDNAAHFLNRAMNFRGLDAFINYFIVLDALFGERGKVEKSICDGVDKLGLEPVWIQKTSKLFDLRSELLHGGSRSVREWQGYTAYQRVFQSEPARDVEFLASTALYNSPSMMQPSNH